MKKLTILIIVITLIGILPCLLQYGNFMIVTDFATQEIPFIVETKRMLSSGIPFWSWNHFIGDNFIGCYSYYTINTPFVWLNCLFPYNYILYGITLTLFLKMICTGWFSYFYFRKMNISENLSIVGGLCYTFSSWSISNLFYYQFLEPMMCFPLFLIGIEKYLRKERFGEACLMLSVFLIAFINYYFMTCSLICGCIYALIRMSSKEINISIKRFVVAGLLIIAGLLLASVMLFPTIAQLQGNERIAINWRMNTDSLYNILERVRTLFAPKLLEQKNELLRGTGWNSNAAHIPVIGMLLACLYCLKNSDWLRWLIILSILVYISPLNGVFSFYTNPMYSRWGYALALFLILGSLKFIEQGGKISRLGIKCYFIVAIGVMVISYGINIINREHNNVSTEGIYSNVLILLLFLFNLILLFIFYKRQNCKTLLTCILVSSIIYVPLRLFMRTDFFSQICRSGLKDGMVDLYILNNQLSEKDESFIYRTDFVTRSNHVYENIGMIRNEPSVASFSSVYSPIIKPLLCLVDTTKMVTNIFNLNNNVESFDALMSVKNVVVYDDPWQNVVSRDKRTRLKSKNTNYKVYDNLNYIPMGFTYDSYLEKSTIDSILNTDPKADIPKQMLSSIVVDNKDIPHISMILKRGTIIPDEAPIDSIVYERRKNVCTSFAGDTHGFSATVDMQRKNLLFFSVPAEKGFTAYVDNQETKIYKVNYCLSAINVDKGSHQIRFEFFPPGLKEGIWISLMMLVPLLLSFIYGYRQNNYTRTSHNHGNGQKNNINFTACI